jgi:hypothetical protein
MQKAFATRLAEDSTFLSSPSLSDAITATFDSPFGHSVIDPCWLVHLENVLTAWRQYLIEKNALIEDVFDFKKLEVTTDQIVYKNYTANKIIFCEAP